MLRWHRCVDLKCCPFGALQIDYTTLLYFAFYRMLEIGYNMGNNMNYHGD